MSETKEDAPTQKTAFVAALEPILAHVQTLDLKTPDAACAALEEKFPVSGETVQTIKRQMREGVQAGWLCEKEAGGVRFSRPKKPADEADLSIDAVHMNSAGPGHTHPNGEVDLCFHVDGAPKFDGRPEGWTVYPPGSWHIPTVSEGTMDILYFLPGGKIEFGPNPKAEQE